MSDPFAGCSDAHTTVEALKTAISALNVEAAFNGVKQFHTSVPIAEVVIEHNCTCYVGDEELSIDERLTYKNELAKCVQQVSTYCADVIPKIDDTIARLQTLRKLAENTIPQLNAHVKQLGLIDA